ncbi:MAG: undecaprenyldiphospho-muramoylpentapeptide beta-N-acetylglucosaminyltransferase [Acidimicrobiia bacterium]
MSTGPVVIAGGGTGGHVYPALALAEELVARGHARDDVRFVGARRGLEARVVPGAGFPVELLPGRGIERRLSLRNIRSVLEILRACVVALGLMRRWHPRVVVGVGGYASVPAVLAARLRRIPVVVHEQNAAPGIANRLAVRLGAVPAVSLPDTPLPGAVLTGNPVRREVLSVERRPDTTRPRLAVVGGSLGARRLNDAALGLYDRWRERRDVTIRHVAGSRDFDRCSGSLDTLRRPDDALVYELVDYEDHMDTLYATSSLVVSRAGAVTVAELTAAGVPSVLVPFPAATGDHQTHNARVVEEAGGAVLLADSDCDAASLEPIVDGILGSPARIRAMTEATRSLARPDAVSDLADLVEEAARA